MLIDTHCHIQDDFPIALGDVLRHAAENDVLEMICVGTDQESSKRALALAKENQAIFAAIGVHPHETKDGYEEIRVLAAEAKEDSKLVAIGEIGLDYFYSNSPREVQQKALAEQIDVALTYNLPISFHVREAFDDFWPIFDSFHGIRGVVHSLTDSSTHLEKALERGLFVGLNGISTFTKDSAQQALFDTIPLDRILFETDAPFLTPKPYRGKINEPAYVRNVAEYHAVRREISLKQIADASTHNAKALFTL